MKPRTKLQREVIDVSDRLRCRDTEVLNWAAVECLAHIGYATKSRVICMDCGKRFSPELVNRRRGVCPHCGAKITVEKTRKSTYEQRVYVGYAEVSGDFQVVRHFEIRSYHKAGSETRYYCDEIVQHFILPSGKHETVARLHTVNWYCNSWNGKLEIRRDPKTWYGNTYNVYARKYHPASVFQPIYTKYGIDHRLEGLTFLDAMKVIPANPIAETLLKARRYDLLAAWPDKATAIRRHWPTLKICFRHKYRINDVSLYFDYLDLLNYFNKDLHSPRYICPSDLKKEHDRLVVKKREIQRKQEVEAEKKKAVRDEAKFRKLKGKFFGISFTDGVVNVCVIDNVLDVVAEGDKLHHCVFTNNYHLKPDSLLLSARINDEPVETVEVSLKKMEVVQCRGKFNGVSEHHDRILKLVNKNLKHIQNQITA